MFTADHRAALLGFVIASAYWPGLLSAPYVPRWTVIAVGLPLASRLDPREVGGVLGGVLLLFIGLGALSLMASPDPMGGTLELWLVVLLCGSVVAGAGMASLDEVMTGLAMGLGLSSIVVVLQALGWVPVGMMSPRPSGLFGNSEIVAEFAAIIFVWALVRPRWGLAILALVPLLLCGSRIALLAAGIGVLYAWWPRYWAERLLLLGMVPVAGWLALTWLGLDKFASAGHRIVLWIATGMAIDPIHAPLGMGLGWFRAAHPSENFAHSDALQALAELGPGSLLLILIPVLAFVRHRGNLGERAAFVAICVEALVSFPLHFPASGFAAALLAGHLARPGAHLCLGQPLGRSQDGSSIQRPIAAGFATHCPSRWRGRAVSVRSLSQGGPAVCAPGVERSCRS